VPLVDDAEGARGNAVAAAVLDAPPEATRIQLPTLIGDVGLNTRSMFRNRSGRPRSLIKRTGETRSAAAPT
jgi:hypothetical protein